MTVNTHIAILMATYNGAAFLREQLESLLWQTEKDWTLVVCDDGSTDETLDILQTYSAKYAQIILLEGGKRCGAKDNFLHILQEVEAPYYCFCDQDDVWCPNKLAIQKKRMMELETLYPDTPILLHTDLMVTDHSLNMLAPSFFSQIHLPIAYLTTFQRCGAANLATGCTMFFNQRAKYITPLPAPQATMHDVWLLLSVLRADGHVECINQALVKYRQHENNTLGLPSPLNRTLRELFQRPRHKFRQFQAQYNMLKALNYGSLLHFLWQKIALQWHIITH